MKRKKPDKNDTDMVLRKHVGLIHCENKLTLVQRKIGNILLFNALDYLTANDVHEIPLRKLCSLVGYNSNDSRLIKASVKALISSVMEWNLLEDNALYDSKWLREEACPKEALTWNASSLLAGASIKEGMIYYSYSPQMRSVLSTLEIYGRINLFVQAKFSSAYSLVLYENCVRFKNIKQTAWFSIDLFRSLMGVPEGKYRPFKELKRNVINVAVNEINQKADIYIEPQFKRTGLRVTAVQFLIRENEQYRPTFKKRARPEPPLPLPLLQQQSFIMEVLLAEFGLSTKQAEKVVEEYQEAYVLEKIGLVKAKKNVAHAGAYLLSALKQDYKPHDKQGGRQPDRWDAGQQDDGLDDSRDEGPHDNQPDRRRSHRRDDRQGGRPTSLPITSHMMGHHPYQREAIAASEISSLRNKYMAYKVQAYVGFIQEQAGPRQTYIREQFERHLQPNAAVWRFYKRSGLSSPFVMAELLAFVEKQFPEIIGEHLSFDDYMTSDEWAQ